MSTYDVTSYLLDKARHTVTPILLAVALATRRLRNVERVNKPLSPSLIHVSGDKLSVSRRRVRAVPVRVLTSAATRRLVPQPFTVDDGVGRSEDASFGPGPLPTADCRRPGLWVGRMCVC